MSTLEQVVDPIAMANEEGNALSLEDAGLMLEANLKSWPGLPDNDENVRKMMVLIGDAGEGKTSKIQQVCAKLNAEIKVFHMGSTIEEDNNGLPYIDKSSGKGITKIALPEHIPCFSRKPNSQSGLGVLVVEECLSGQIMHQNFLRSVVDRVWPNGDRMYEGWKIVGTTNPETSEYATVKSADRAVASRMCFLRVKATSDEKLRHWSGSMPTTVYNFLLMYHTNQETLNPIERLDTRAWYNLADTVARHQAAGLPNRLNAALIRTHCGRELEAAFTQYLAKGNNPDEYPISHTRLLLGFNKTTGKQNDVDVVKEEHARVGRWLQKDEVPLLGATKWELKSFFKNTNNLQRMKTDSPFYHVITNNLCAFMIDLGKGGYAEHAEDLCQTVKDATPHTNDRFIRDVLNQIKGTPLEKKLVGMFESYQVEKREEVAV